jgi:hypothetical protein
MAPEQAAGRKVDAQHPASAPARDGDTAFAASTPTRRRVRAQPTPTQVASVPRELMADPPVPEEGA